MINRQLNHAIAELERVQPGRKEEATPSTYNAITKQSQVRNKAKKVFDFSGRISSSVWNKAKR